MNPATNIVNTAQAMDFQKELLAERIAALQKAAGIPTPEPNEAQVGAMSRANNLLCEALSILYGEVDR